MRYKLFGRRTGLRVSELVLGAAMFGHRWGYGTEPDEPRRIFEAYAEAGGNFIDTANAYQFGESEEIVGGLLQGKRDDFVLATKYTNGANPEASIAATGNSRKAMVASVEASLKRLKTDHVDLLWAHLTDLVTPMEEIVRGFDDLARAGKIRYAGLSNFPAWRVGYAVAIAELRGAVPIAALQVEHSLVERTTEHELIPAAHGLGLAVGAWSPLGGGLLTGKYRQGEAGRKEGFGGNVFQAENSQQRTAIVDAVIAMAKEIGVTPGEVAIAWVKAKGSFPIIGPRTLKQFEENLRSAELTLMDEQIKRLDDVSAIAPTFPERLVVGAWERNMFTGGKADQLDWPQLPVA
ncbi:aldo/keto reductase [Caballeronia sordidicola]|uniref:Aldo/keto reductase n=1 Tax=Caballeronia sordidicola TaxID=196367 RepID=A0A158EQ54_CABSO|nr:aldo/keto reductase [Caballeronia sordidicola]SAL09698.1 aldo/keto reductase [Caballeronia sordidicola]